MKHIKSFVSRYDRPMPPPSVLVDQVAAGALPRDRIVLAAERCFAQYGVTKTTVEDVAAVAGTSRASVYRHFPGGRDEIILAALVSSAKAFVPQIPARWRSARTVGDAIVELIVGAVAWVRSEPWREALLTTPLSRTLSASDTAATYAVCVTFIGPYFEQARAAGLVRPRVGVEDAVEFVVRMIHSLLVVPGHVDRTDAQLRRYLRTFVVSALLVS
jgi:AcrR family transcriptional regulator